jgi:5-methylcytosine-specific restriction endonuclease McrA
LAFDGIKHLIGEFASAAAIAARADMRCRAGDLENLLYTPVHRGAMSRALILNATHQPLAVVTARRAVVLVLKDKAEVVVPDGMVFHSERLDVEAPSVVRLRYFVKVPYRARAALTRRAVFARDDWSCQYCGRSAENLDHVVPRSRGGAHSWENVVAACRRCNSRKENRLPNEVGLSLPRKPFAPADGFRLSLGRLEPAWEPYLT